MGATVNRNTIPGGKTPICNLCMISLCWDISDEEYADDKKFWDAWICQECNGGVPMQRRSFEVHSEEAKR